jgi:hypothetical protein
LRIITYEKEKKEAGRTLSNDRGVESGRKKEMTRKEKSPCYLSKLQQLHLNRGIFPL